jgi:ABC-2 type transport system ATP-binding protein
MTTCICMENVTKSYGATTAVSALNLTIESGEIFGVIGPNGAGKSTTLAMLAGLVRPSSGTISIFGKDREQQALYIAQRTGVLTEDPSFYEHLTVARNLMLFARLAGQEITLNRTLDLAGLDLVAEQRVGTLSRGMRQRLGLAQAFLTEPELLLLDEPTSALDAEQSTEVVELLRRLSKEARVTIVLSSHQIDEIEALCDRVAVLDRGQLVACDRTEALLAYDKTQVDVLLESAEAAGRRLQQEPWVESVEVRRGRLRVRLKEGGPHQLNSFLVGAGYQVSGLVPRRRSIQELYLKASNR